MGLKNKNRDRTDDIFNFVLFVILLHYGVVIKSKWEGRAVGTAHLPFSAGRCIVCQFPRWGSFRKSRFVQDLRACIMTVDEEERGG